MNIRSGLQDALIDTVVGLMLESKIGRPVGVINLCFPGQQQRGDP